MNPLSEETKLGAETLSISPQPQERGKDDGPTNRFQGEIRHGIVEGSPGGGTKMSPAKRDGGVPIKNNVLEGKSGVDVAQYGKLYQFLRCPEPSRTF